MSKLMGMTENGSEKIPTRRNWASFWSLLTLQTQNAFNDKAAQFLLIPLAGALALQTKNAGHDIGFLGENMAHVLGALIVLPFIVLAPISGWCSDRFSKSYVIRGTLVMQLVVLAMIVVAIQMQSLGVAVFGFLLLSVESVMLSPAKKGIVKELVGTSRLGFASGLLEMTVVLAVCFGQIVSGWWYDIRREAGYGIWDAASLPMLLISLAAIVSLVLSFGVERVEPLSKKPFTWKLPFEHFGQLKDLWEDRRIRLSGVGVAFFWGFAGFMNLVAIQIGSEISGGDIGFGSENSWLMLAASGGITLGGVAASLICKKKIELGLVPIGGVVMVLGSMALALGPIERGWLMVWMAITGSGGALLLVPLNAYLQDICHPEKRGRVLAGLNLLDCLAGFFAVLVQFAMFHFGVSYFLQFGALALVSGLVTCYSARLVPQHFVRFVLLVLFRSVYRVKVMNVEKIPQKGGVLLTPNHVSYIDAFILSASCPRPIRFMLFDEYFEHPVVGRFVKLFDAIPISKTRAKEGMRAAAKALKNGEVVCIFPEGQITRSGGMNTFMRGFEMIARSAKAPVLPVAMDGVWSSIFSFERNRFIYKKPYSLPCCVSVNFGEMIDAKEVDAMQVRLAIEALRAEAFSERKMFIKPRDLLRKQTKVLHGGSLIAKAEKSLADMSDDDLRPILANACQMAELNTIQRGQTVMMESKACPSVLILYAKYHALKLVVVDDLMSESDVVRLVGKYEVSQFLGGKFLADIWGKSELVGNCYDLSADAVLRSDDSERVLFPCCVEKGKVISMSMPHPLAQTRINDHQDGYRVGTWGRLLPGFEVVCNDSEVRLSGLSTSDEKIFLPNMRLGEDGMLEVG